MKARLSLAGLIALKAGLHKASLQKVTSKGCVRATSRAVVGADKVRRALMVVAGVIFGARVG